MKKAVLKTIYRVGGFAPFRWAGRGNALILTYHRFSRREHPSRISAGEFEKHLRYLQRHNRVVPLSEIAEALQNGERLPPSSVALTIDDGYRDAYEIAFPLLQKYDFPATLFAITDFLAGRIWLWTDKMRYLLQNTKVEKIRFEPPGGDTIDARIPAGEIDRLRLAGRINSILKKLPDAEKERQIEEIAARLGVEIPAAPVADYAALDWAQAREMDRAGVRMESHTVTHPMLTQVEQARLDFELRTSKERLEEKLNREVRVFCYPSGAFDDAVRQAVVGAGYGFAVSTRYGFAGRPVADMFALKRIDAQPGIADFAQSVSGFEAFKLKVRGGA